MSVELPIILSYVVADFDQLVKACQSLLLLNVRIAVIDGVVHLRRPPGSRRSQSTACGLHNKPPCGRPSVIRFRRCAVGIVAYSPDCLLYRSCQPGNERPLNLWIRGWPGSSSLITSGWREPLHSQLVHGVLMVLAIFAIRRASRPVSVVLPAQSSIFVLSMELLTTTFTTPPAQSTYWLFAYVRDTKAQWRWVTFNTTVLPPPKHFR